MIEENEPNNHLVIQKKIGSKIKEIRKAKGRKNYEKFANKIGLARSHYWRIEAGEENITMKSLIKILHALDTSLGDFFSDLE